MYFERPEEQLQYFLSCNMKSMLKLPPLSLALGHICNKNNLCSMTVLIFNLHILKCPVACK